jgi:hypothetical protein
MADIIFVTVICAFFALCVVYIRWCDRIIGSDDSIVTVDAVLPDEDADAAVTPVGVSA